MPFRVLITILSSLIVAMALIFPARASGGDDGEATRYLRDAAEAYMHGDNLKALHECHHFLRFAVARENGEVNDSILAECYRILGNIHFNQGDFPKAMRYFRLGLEINTDHGKRLGDARLLNNMTMASCFLGDKKQATLYMKQADAGSMGNASFDAFMRNVRHALYQRSFGDWQKSVALMKSADKMAMSGEFDSRFRLTPISELYQMYEENGRLDSALYYLDEYSRLAAEYEAASMMIDAERGYMRVLLKMPGRTDEVMKHVQRYFELSDSVMDSGTFQQLSEQYEEELKTQDQQRIQTLQFQVSNLHVILLVIGLVVVIGLFIWVWISTRRRLKKAYSFVFKSNRSAGREEMRRRKQHTVADDAEDADASALKPEAITDAHSQSVSPGSEKDDLLSDTLVAAGEATMADSECLPMDDDASSVEEETENEEEDDASRLERMLPRDLADSLATRIEKVMDSSEEWLDPDFSISRLASMVGSNTKYVSACINERYGKNFRSFINEYRIRTALRRMSDTEHYGNLTIGAIASSVGFRSSTNFISAFRKVTGITPSSYLRLARE